MSCAIADDLTLFVLKASSARQSACSPFTELSNGAINGAAGESTLGSCAGTAAEIVVFNGHGAGLISAVIADSKDFALAGAEVGDSASSVLARGGARAPVLPIADIAVDGARVVLTGAVPFRGRAGLAACNGFDNYTRLHANTTVACKRAIAIG